MRSIGTPVLLSRGRAKMGFEFGEKERPVTMKNVVFQALLV